MKKTAKTLLGVLNVGALVGTGYAMWHVNGGFISYTTDGVAPGIETIVDDKFGTLEVTAIDDKIRFDSNYNKETGEDLDVSYKVKAVANVIDGKPSDRDPYDLSFYETISSEYLPNLKVTTVAMKGEQELEGTDPFFKYVNLPVFDTVSYKEWLSAEAKANEGYVVNLNFTWGDETEGINPDEYWRTLDPVTQKANFEDLTSALKDVTFKFVFEVGGDDSVVVDNKTDEITITTVEGSTLSIEGMSNGTVTEGTHQVTLDVTEENKVLKDSKVYVTYTDQEGVPGNDEIILEAQNGRTVYETYVGEYTFKANFKYELTYELVDDTPETQIKTFYFKDLKNLNSLGSKAYIYTWKEGNGENASFPGVELTQLSWNIFDDEANIYVGEIDVAKYDNFVFSTSMGGQTRDISVSELGNNNFVIMTDSLGDNKYDVQFADYETEMKAKEATVNVSYNADEGKVEYEDTTYYNNYGFTFTVTPEEGYKVGEVIFNTVSLDLTDDNVYSVSLESGVNNVEVTFISTAVKTGTIEFVENTNVKVTAYVGDEEYDNAELPVGTEVTLNVETVTPNYVIKEVKVNDTTIQEKEGTYKFNVVEQINKVEIIGEVVFDPFENPKVVSPSEIANKEFCENTYFETTCIVKSLRSNGIVMTDSENLDLSIDCNLLYSTEEKFINNVEYNVETGKYSEKSDKESSDKFDTELLDIGDLVIVRGFTNSTGYFKGYFVEKVKDSSEINYKITINEADGGTVKTQGDISEAPVNTEVILEITPSDGNRVDQVLFNGMPVSANDDNKYVITTTFVNEISVSFTEADKVTYEPLVIDSDKLSKISGKYQSHEEILIVKDSNGSEFEVTFEYYACSQSSTIQMNGSSCYIKNITAFPAAIDYIEISNFTDASNKQIDISTYLNYGTAEEQIETGEEICTSYKLDAIGENDTYFAINPSSVKKSFRIPSFTIYFK